MKHDSTQSISGVIRGVIVMTEYQVVVRLPMLGRGEDRSKLASLSLPLVTVPVMRPAAAAATIETSLPAPSPPSR